MGTHQGISTISAWLSADFGVVSNVVVVAFIPWVEVKSSREFSSSPCGQYSSDVAKDSGEESPELSPVPDEDVNSWISAISERPRGEERSHAWEGGDLTLADRLLVGGPSNTLKVCQNR